MTMKKLVSVLATMGLCAATWPIAGMADFYVGAGVGSAKVDSLSAPNINDGSTFSSSSVDDSDTGWKLFGGMQLNRFVALEASWVDLGKATTDTVSDGSGSIAPGLSRAYAEGDVHAETDAQGLALEGLGMYPVMDSLSVYLRFGLFLSDTDETITDTVGTVRDANDQDRDLTFGLGAKYDFNDHFGIRADWQRFENVGRGSSGIDLISVGGQYTF